MEKTNTTPENSIESNNSEQTESEIEQSKKVKDKSALIKKILIIAIAILLILLVIIILVFLLKSPKEEVVENTQTVEDTTASQEIEMPEPKEFKFDFNNLDPEKLNEQLALLTNKNMEFQKVEEFNNTEKKEKEISTLFPQDSKENTEPINEDKKEQNITQEDDKKPEESILVKEDITTKEASENKIENTTPIKEEVPVIKETLSFVKLINVAKIKGDLNKRYLDKAVSVNPNILLCRDDENNIELYYGPFLDDEIKDELLKKLLEKGFKEAYILEMLEDEFNKRCNY